MIKKELFFSLLSTVVAALSAGYAWKQSDLTEGIFLTTQRPWLKAEVDLKSSTLRTNSPLLTAELRLNLTIKNVGALPANQVRISYTDIGRHQIDTYSRNWFKTFLSTASEPNEWIPIRDDSLFFPNDPNLISSTISVFRSRWDSEQTCYLPSIVLRIEYRSPGYQDSRALHTYLWVRLFKKDTQNAPTDICDGSNSQTTISLDSLESSIEYLASGVD